MVKNIRLLTGCLVAMLIFNSLAQPVMAKEKLVADKDSLFGFHSGYYITRYNNQHVVC